MIYPDDAPALAAIVRDLAAGSPPMGPDPTTDDPEGTDPVCLLCIDLPWHPGPGSEIHAPECPWLRATRWVEARGPGRGPRLTTS